MRPGRTARRRGRAPRVGPLVLGAAVGALLVAGGLPQVVDGEVGPGAPVPPSALGAPAAGSGPADPAAPPAAAAAGAAPATGPGGGGQDEGVAGTRRSGGTGPNRVHPATASPGGPASGEPLKVGFLLLDVAAAGRLGVNVAIDPEQQESAYRAFVAEVNERGGILGRPVDPRFAVYDVASEDSMRAACIELTEDEKVFAVVGSFNLAPPVFCIVDEHRTPLFSNQATNPDELFARSGGRLFSIFPRDTRMAAMWVAELARLRAIQTKVVGILSHDGSDPTGRTADVLTRHLQRAGAEEVVEVQLQGDVSETASQVPIAVNRMRSAGVEIVLFTVGMTIPGTSFVQQAERQNYRPAYSATDIQSNFGDTNAQAMPESFDGAISVTTTRNSEFRSGTPEPAEAVRCREVYERRTRSKLAERGSNEYALTVSSCDTFGIFVAGARAAGPSLDAGTLAAGVASLGAVRLGGWGGGAFARGKPDLNDVVRIQRWRHACRCWQPDGGFRPPGGS